MKASSADEHGSRLFLLEEGREPRPLAHDDYVAIARRERGRIDLAGRRLRLADWYLRLHEGRPQRLVSEWYGWVAFDDAGCFDPTPGDHGRHGAGGAIDESALPSAQERQAIARLLGVGATSRATDLSGADRAPDGTPPDRYAG